MAIVMQIPMFDKKEVYENRINRSSCVTVIKDVQKVDLDAYEQFLIQSGYEKVETRSMAVYYFAAYRKDEQGVFLNYYTVLQEMTVVTEEGTRYFDFSDTAANASTVPQITQVHLEDFGMSYVIRLSDGRFIVIDGGREFEPDARRLYDVLKRGTPCGKPTVAAWIMTHPHSDHFHCFIPFMDLFADDVVVEKYMLTFPERDDEEHYPALMKDDVRFENDISAYANIPKMFERMEKSGAPVYAPHTGQIYVIGDAVCEILGSIDDTIHRSKNVNATSLVIRMTLGGQVILWGADACFSELRLTDKYREHLKADILQIPHHGFQSGNAEAEIEGYRVIAPRVCLLPVADYNAYICICTYREGTRYLMRDAGVEEMITGDVERTLDLPYIPPKSAKAELERKYLSGRASCGATCWIFSDLEASVPEDFCYSILNTTNTKATVWIELFFEDTAKNVRFIKTEVAARSLKRLSVIGEDVDGDAFYFKWMSLKERGVPEEGTFAMRFLCDTPIVVSHKTHACIYKSSYHD